jgi:hypothetical protein
MKNQSQTRTTLALAAAGLLALTACNAQHHAGPTA